jgi:hypothetical protein
MGRLSERFEARKQQQKTTGIKDMINISELSLKAAKALSDRDGKACLAVLQELAAAKVEPIRKPRKAVQAFETAQAFCRRLKLKHTVTNNCGKIAGHVATTSEYAKALGISYDDASNRIDRQIAIMAGKDGLISAQW